MESVLESHVHTGVREYVRERAREAPADVRALRREGLPLCFRAKLTTEVGGEVPVRNPLCSMIICDSDSSTFQEAEIGDDGLVLVNFVLATQEQPHVVERLTKRLKVHFYGKGMAEKPGFKFGVASGSLPLEALLRRNCEVHDVPVPALADGEAAGNIFSFQHNFAGVCVKMEIVGSHYGRHLDAEFLAGKRVRAEDDDARQRKYRQKMALPVAPDEQLRRYRHLVERGAITESVLRYSKDVNDLILQHSDMLQQNLEKVLQMDTPRGVTNFAGMRSAFPMQGENLLYPDMSLAMMHSRHEYTPIVACLYSIAVGYNLNDILPRQAEKLSDHNLSFIMADSSTFFTVDAVAGAYVSDVNFATVVPKEQRSKFANNRWQGMLTLGPTECITQALSAPNCDGIVFSTNDCEDQARSILCNMKGYIEAALEMRRDPVGFAKHFENQLLSTLHAADREGIRATLERFYRMSGPLRARLAAVRGVVAPFAEEEEWRGLQVDVCNVLGTALGASADKETGSYGGHAYGHMVLTPPRPAADAHVGAPYANVGAISRPENLTLEGTACVHNVDSAPGEQYVHVRNVVEMEELPVMMQQGFGFVERTADGRALVEIPMPVDDYLNYLRAAPCMQSSQKDCRRSIAICSLAQFTKRRLAGRGPASPEQMGERLREDAEIAQKARTSFYQDAICIGHEVATDLRLDAGGALGDGLEESSRPWLGTFFPTYTPDKPGVALTPITGQGMAPEDFETMNAYKLARLSEIFAPLLFGRMTEMITARWKPIFCSARDRGDGVNEYMQSIHCVSVSESSADRAEQAAQERAAELTAQKTNADMQRKGLPHEMRTWNGIHSAVRTLVFHKETAEREVVRQHTGKGKGGG